MPNKILVIVSAADKIPLKEGGSHETGIFLGELVESIEPFLNAGFKIDFASPGGKEPTVDKNSLNLIYWGFSKKRLKHGQDLYSRLLHLGLASPMPLEVLAKEAGEAKDRNKLSEYKAVLVPGGHAPMVDLLHKNSFEDDDSNTDFGIILWYFHVHQIPTGLICHAPAALASAPLLDGKWIYSGYRMTTITRGSEWFAEDMPFFRVIHGHIKEYPTDVLRKAGAVLIQNNLPMASLVVEDRELVTGQDPFAAREFGRKLFNRVAITY